MDGRDGLPLIGWRERVDLPEWGLRRVQAKVDTGARTSAIDVARIEDLPDGSIRFEVVARTAPTRKTKWITARPSREARVRPSSGEAQDRRMCVTTIRIGEFEREVEVGLVCRREMKCRMLVGRSAIAGLFAVDAERKYLLSAAPRAARGDA